MVHINNTDLLRNLDQLANRDFDTLRKKKRIKSNYDNILENEELLNTFDIDRMKIDKKDLVIIKKAINKIASINKKKDYTIEMFLKEKKLL